MLSFELDGDEQHAASCFPAAVVVYAGGTLGVEPNLHAATMMNMQAWQNRRRAAAAGDLPRRYATHRYMMPAKI